MNDKTLELEAAVFRRLRDHLSQHSEVQNIELMVLADFCRNCLAKWYLAAAEERGIDLNYEQARELIYGMPYSEWKDRYQTEATAEQLAAYESKQKIKSFTMMDDKLFDAMFSGVIGQEYQMLKLICPFAAELSRLVGVEVSEFSRQANAPLNVLELGGGTGITTLSILSADERLKVLSVDNEPTMQNQAKQSLAQWAEAGRLAFCGDDALTALKKLDSDSIDIVASAYTLHNFTSEYRKWVIQEIFRVLKTGGRFINGDRYALDDITTHTRNTQQEVAGYFKALKEIDRLDVLEHWIIHLFSDESESCIMRESVAIQQLTEAGFSGLQIKLRNQVNALLTADKP